MANYAQIPWASKWAQAESGVVSLERLLNLYPEQNPQGSKSPVTLYPTPGLLAWSEIGDGPIRGMHLMGSDVFVASGPELYKVDSAKVATLIGGIDSTGPVHMVDNGTQVAVITSTSVYSATTSAIVAVTTGAMNGLAYQDGYGIYTERGTQQWWISNLDDFDTITGTDFTSADSLPDNVVGCVSDHRELWIFKELSTEIYQNTGAAAFPFQRVQMIERGCAGHGSIAKADNAVFWLGDDLRVYMAQGYTPQPISQPWVDAKIQAQDDTATARAFVYRQRGHVFFTLIFANLALSFDTTTGVWHERSSTDSVTGEQSRWRVNCHEAAFGLNLVGDYETGDIYSLDLETYTDNGETLLREVICPPLFAHDRLATLSEVYLDAEAGVGLVSGQGSDPTIMLSWSDDGGHSWVDDRLASLGALGAYGHRAKWNRLGAFRQRSLRFRISDPVNVVLLQAYGRIGAGL